MVFLAKATKEKGPDGKERGGFDFGSEYNRIRLQVWLKDHVGQEIRITPVMAKRSGQQNNFYWLYLERIEFETGNNANDLHEYFKRVFLKPKFITVLGKEIKIPASTTELTKLEFGEYMEKICAETSVEIPDAVGYRNWLDSAPTEGEYPGDKKNGQSTKRKGIHRDRK